MHRRRKRCIDCEFGSCSTSLSPTSGDLSPGQSLRLIGSSGFLNGVSCPSRSACLAVGENPNGTRGIAVPLNPATAMVRRDQEPHFISGIVMSGVACATKKQCLGVGHDSLGSGVVVALNPTTGTVSSGQTVQAIAGTGGLGLEGVACPSASLCVAVGENSLRSAGIAVPLNPATGAIRRGQSVQNVTHKGILVNVACPSTTVCLAVGWGASQPSVVAVPIDPRTGALLRGQSDQSVSARAAMLTAVTCPFFSFAWPWATTRVSLGWPGGADRSNNRRICRRPTHSDACGNGRPQRSCVPPMTQCVAAGSRFESAGAMTEILDPATGRGS